VRPASRPGAAPPPAGRPVLGGGAPGGVAAVVRPRASAARTLDAEIEERERFDRGIPA
jgi:hypothetical protein